MGTPARLRLAECRRQHRTCEVRECYKPAQKWGRYCEAHDRTNERTGHPEGNTVRISVLRPYLDMTRRYIRENEEHSAIRAALRWLTATVYGPRSPTTHLRQNATPRQRLNRWLDKMKRQGIRPEEMLAMIAGLYLLREDQPRDFKNDRHFNHQLAIRLLRMIRAPWAERWAGGKPYRRYDRITVGVRELLSKQTNEALGVMCIRMARAIQAGLRQHGPDILAGIDTPLPTPAFTTPRPHRKSQSDSQ